MLKLYSASSFCLPNKKRVGVTHGDGTNLEVVYTSVSDTTVAVRKFLAYESRQMLEYEIFSRTKISAITVYISTGRPLSLIQRPASR